MFQLLVRLLFKCGFYSRVHYMQCFQSAKPVKAVWHDVIWTVKARVDFLNVKKSVSKRKQTLWNTKSGEI